MIDDDYYESQADARRRSGVAKNTLWRRLRSDKFPNYRFV